jgi:hypothetical protein
VLRGVTHDRESHGEFTIESVGLIEHPDSHATAASDFASIGLSPATQQTQQR